MEPGPVQEGRDAYRRSEWSKAHAALSALDELGELGPADLELLSDTKFMLGDPAGMIETLERAHHGYVERDDVLLAARTAGWLGANYASRDKGAQASGWLERAQRLIDQVEGDCVERGYLLLPTMFRYLDSGDLDRVVELTVEADAIGRRFRDADLVALTGHLHGRALLRQGLAEEANKVLDEVMISVVGGRLSPRVTGIVYCGVVDCCFQAHEIKRAAEWTSALSAWVDSQPDLVAFTDQCLAHRSEILFLQGTWNDALAEAKLAHEHKARGQVAAQAAYQQAEIHRLRGELELAEQAYREVGLKGIDPQPGLALLRAAQGNVDAAAASIGRAVSECADLTVKAMLLAAQVEVTIEIGDLLGAEAAANDLAGIVEQTRIEMHMAWAASGRGALELARSNHDSALLGLREAIRRWNDLGVPYELARARFRMAQALAALGDDEAADIELEAARAVFFELGAAPDVRRIDDLRRGDRTDKPHGLTQRELEVLRLLTSGASNRSIASDLVLSERTIDRHVSNIFTKLGVSSRAAATAFAIRNQLV